MTERSEGTVGSTAELEGECRALQDRVKSLEAIIRRQQFIEDRYEELMLSARRCWRYYGADQQLFDASLRALDFLIRRHATEIDEMDDEADEPSNAEVSGDER